MLEGVDVAECLNWSILQVAVIAVKQLLIGAVTVRP